jgi:hypothetical protein
MKKFLKRLLLPLAAVAALAVPAGASATITTLQAYYECEGVSYSPTGTNPPALDWCFDGSHVPANVEWWQWAPNDCFSCGTTQLLIRPKSALGSPYRFAFYCGQIPGGPPPAVHGPWLWSGTGWQIVSVPLSCRWSPVYPMIVHHNSGSQGGKNFEGWFYYTDDI